MLMAGQPLSRFSQWLHGVDGGAAHMTTKQSGLPAETLPDRVGVFAYRFVGEADENRNRDDQQQDHHNARAAQMTLDVPDGVHIRTVGAVFGFHCFATRAFSSEVGCAGNPYTR
jgi:hypothetical protein